MQFCLFFKKILIFAFINFTGRRSVSACTSDTRTPWSSSPTKSPLKLQILTEIKKVDQDEDVLETITRVIKNHGSLNALNNFEDDPPGVNNFIKCSPERSSFRSPRKDSKGHSHLSKIPAPVFFGKT